MRDMVVKGRVTVLEVVGGIVYLYHMVDREANEEEVDAKFVLPP